MHRTRVVNGTNDRKRRSVLAGGCRNAFVCGKRSGTRLRNGWLGIISAELINFIACCKRIALIEGNVSHPQCEPQITRCALRCTRSKDSDKFTFRPIKTGEAYVRIDTIIELYTNFKSFLHRIVFNNLKRWRRDELSLTIASMWSFQRKSQLKVSPKIFSEWSQEMFGIGSRLLLKNTILFAFFSINISLTISIYGLFWLDAIKIHFDLNSIQFNIQNLFRLSCRKHATAVYVQYLSNIQGRGRFRNL